jgi:hypothetical protein
MMMMTKRLLPFLLLFLSAGRVYCQDKDFGLWYEVNAEKALNKKFDITGTVMLRTFDNASTLDQAYVELGASYSPNKYLGFAASYRLGNYLEKDDLYHIRHKWFADVKGSLPVGRLIFSVRLRFQIMARTFLEDAATDVTEYDGRIKLKALYKIPDFPVNPYLSFESFSPVFRTESRLIDKSRSAAGLEFKISKKHILGTEYIYERDNLPHLSIMHIIDLSYTFKF